MFLPQTMRRPVLAAAALALSGCAAISQAPPSTSNPESAAMSHSPHEVAITRTAVIPGPPAAVFDFVAAEDVLPKVLTGYGPLPAVLRTSGHTGAWDVAGSARLIHLADGSTVREQVTHYSRGSHFAYRVWEFGNPLLKRLATGARGEWTFTPEGAGTRVVWTYTFTATNGLAALPLSAITRLFWRGYMEVCLANTRRWMAQAPPA
jgi:Polyketide cyclase / dehydrase and lipid transport